MDSIGEGPLKLGRISRKVEKALGLSLVCDVNIYLPQPQLDQLAASRPHDYLKRLDEISGICRDPDYVRYDESNDTFIYLKEYIKDGVFLKVAVDLTHEGDPKRWVFGKMYVLSDSLARVYNASHLFVRPIDSR